LLNRSGVESILHRMEKYKGFVVWRRPAIQVFGSVTVILSEAKDLCSFLHSSTRRRTAGILRFAQDDNNSLSSGLPTTQDEMVVMVE